MSVLDKLVSQGAYSCAGQLLMKHTVCGNFRNGDFFPTAEGLAMAEIDDVVIKSETPKKGKKKAEAVEVAEADPTEDFDMDSLLAQ